MAQNFNLKSIVRPNILKLQPYRCARDDFTEGILLDANENGYGPAIENLDNGAKTDRVEINNLHRYPDPHQLEVKAGILKLRPELSSTEQIFLGVGSDEVIDIVIRIFCQPGVDKILVTPPTYGMYKVCAQVNDVEVVTSNLLPNAFQLNVPEIKEKILEHGDRLKLLFLCSPGNPTGTKLQLESIFELLNFTSYKGMVLIDEAYIDFADEGANGSSSLTHHLAKYPNMLIFQTLSKSFGLAGIRLGLGIGHPDIIQIMNNTKAPYNISSLTSQVAKAALTETSINQMKHNVSSLLAEREKLVEELVKLKGVGQPLGKLDANFVLIPILSKCNQPKPDNDRALAIYQFMARELKVVIRYRATEPNCAGCLRITVGTPEENSTMLKCLKEALEKF